LYYEKVTNGSFTSFSSGTLIQGNDFDSRISRFCQTICEMASVLKNHFSGKKTPELELFLHKSESSQTQTDPKPLPIQNKIERGFNLPRIPMIPVQPNKTKPKGAIQNVEYLSAVVLPSLYLYQSFLHCLRVSCTYTAKWMALNKLR
jgi:hypothetical protein